jgi:hypothetical protein
LRKLRSVNDSFVDVIETQFKNFIKIIIISNVFKNRILFFLTSTLFLLIINVIKL